MKHLLSIALAALFISGCHSGGNSAAPDTETQRRADSLALKVALMPTLDCLPFYYAERCGMFKELGLDVRLLTFKAQMDCDTAFARHHADVCYTDLVRAALLQSKGTGLYVIMQADGHHELVALKTRRIRQARHLKERTVGMARHSVTDLLLDTVIGQARLDAFTVYHPQINDINLRCGMLQNGTIDAAFLTEPYITQAKTEGHNSIYDSRKQDIRLMAFMATAEATTDKRKQEQIKLLLQAYNKATERINHKELTDSIRRILLQYPVSAATIDSLRLPEYKKAEKAETDQAATAIGFLKRRKLIPAQYTGDTLITTSFIP